MSNSAIIINQLQKAKPSTVNNIPMWAENFVHQITSNASNVNLGYVSFMNVINFMAGSLINLMSVIAAAALIIASALFTFEIIRMIIEYFITHEAKKLTQSMVRKLMLFLIVTAFATHIQAIMAFIFGSFVKMGVAVGSSFAGSGNLSNPLYAWGVLGVVWTSSLRIIVNIDNNIGLIGSIQGVPSMLLVFMIMLIITLLIIFIVIQYFIVQLEILIQASIGSVAIAFSMLSYTQDITKGYIKSLLNAGIRLFTIIVIIFFFNFGMEYVMYVFNALSPTGYFNNVKNPFELLLIIQISMLFLVILCAFLVAKAPTIVANAMSGSGTGSGMDAGIVMGAAAAGAFEGANVAAGVGKAGAGAAGSAAAGVWNAPGAIMDAPGNIKAGIGEAADKFKGDWDKRMNINKDDFAQPPNPFAEMRMQESDDYKKSQAWSDEKTGIPKG